LKFELVEAMRGDAGFAIYGQEGSARLPR
jgi:hypothetical protein